MVKVNVGEAKANLSQLLKQVEEGEEVIIARNGQPVAKLVSLPAKQNRDKRQPGLYKGRIRIDDSFFDPLPEEELKAWEGG